MRCCPKVDFLTLHTRNTDTHNPTPPHFQTKPSGGTFHLIDYSAFPHTLRLPISGFLDELTSKGALHAALGSSRRRAFHAAVRRLAERHFGPAAAGPLVASSSGQQEGPAHLDEQQAAGCHPQRQGSSQVRHAQVRAVQESCPLASSA